MSIDATTLKLLNDFSLSQPALNDSFKPRATSGLRLGDMIKDATNDKKTVKGTYNFAKQGGAQGDYFLLTFDGTPLTLPENAILTGLWTRVLTTLASGGLADIILKTGAQTIKASTDFDNADWTGLDDQTDPLKTNPVVVPTLISATGPLIFEIATADLTAGAVDIWVEYLTS